MLNHLISYCFLIVIEPDGEVLRFYNYNLTDICTPINVEALHNLLHRSNYLGEEMEFIVDGFTNGFKIEYCGPEDRRDTSRNLPLTIGNKTILWNKVMKEVQLGRYAGPYDDIPYDNFIQSPIGLVPKAGNKTRLIFHLSYTFPNGNQSVNYWTPEHLCSVKYNDLDHAIDNCNRLDKTRRGDINHPLFFAKTDLSSAYRVAPLRPDQYRWLIMMAEDPVSGKKQYFVEKNLMFGGSISCSHFQRISNGMRHAFEWLTGRQQQVTNYLDDFLFIATNQQVCDHLISEFLQMCQIINFPVSEEKTEFARTEISFLGMILNGVWRRILVPEDKRIRTLSMLQKFVYKKKATIKEIQGLAGLLNFLNKAIVPGRAFMRRMYSKYAGLIETKRGNFVRIDSEGKSTQLKRYHHINLDAEFRNDCKVWLTFLSSKIHMAINRPFRDICKVVTAEEVHFYSDAAKIPSLG